MNIWGIFKSLFYSLLLYAFISGLVVLMMNGCGHKKKERKLKSFDSEAWIKDKNGCDGIRLSMKTEILNLKYRMRGLSAEEVEDLLGSPDATELSERSQKYYIYYLEPGPVCTESSNKENHALALLIRFTAVGIANEFTMKSM